MDSGLLTKITVYFWQIIIVNTGETGIETSIELPVNFYVH